MKRRQIVAPNLNTTDYPGWCLRMVGNAFGTKPRPFDRARKAWEGAKFRHTDALPNDVAVPVFFSWYGTIGNEYDNWGDVAIWVPGRGVFGSPLQGSGKSFRWDPDVQARARAIGGKAAYVGWTEDLNGVKLVENVVVAQQPEGAEMIATVQEADQAYKMLRPNGSASQAEINGTAGKRTYKKFLSDAQPEIALRDKALREQSTYIVALQNDLNTMKKQADDLLQRPTKSAFTELHNNLVVCTQGANKQVEYIDTIEKELEQVRANQYNPSEAEKVVRRILNGAQKLLPLNKIMEIFRSFKK